MNAIEQLSLGLQACRYTAREILRPALWLPFALLLAGQSAVLGVLLLWAHPMVSWALAPLVRHFAGAGALHYPAYFQHLPGLARGAGAVLGLSLAPLALGVGSRLFAWRWRGQAFTSGVAWREVVPRWGELVLVSLPPALVIAAALHLGEHVLPLRLTGLFRMLLPAALGLLTWLIQMLWAYAIILVVVDRRSALEAWRELPHTWEHGALGAGMVLIVAALLQWPAVWLVDRAPVVVARGLPELVGIMVAIRFLFGAFAAFIVTGALTLLWTSSLSDARSTE